VTLYIRDRVDGKIKESKKELYYYMTEKVDWNFWFIIATVKYIIKAEEEACTKGGVCTKEAKIISEIPPFNTICKLVDLEEFNPQLKDYVIGHLKANIEPKAWSVGGSKA
jgi:hypothetical protein